MRRRYGFTLIELLIVVAIIAILAAIAVPNFLEAQTRAKVSRAKADMRSLATAVEAYYIDYNNYPYTGGITAGGTPFGFALPQPGDATFGLAEGLRVLSTPVAYITNAGVVDPFKPGFDDQDTMAGVLPERAHLGYIARDAANNQTGPTDTDGGRVYWWILDSGGPDRDIDNLAGTGGALAQSTDAAVVAATANITYDPTNGTVSGGSVYRPGGAFNGQGQAGGQFLDSHK